MKLMLTIFLTIFLCNSAHAVKKLDKDYYQPLSVSWDNDKRYSVGATTCQFKGDETYKFPCRCKINGYGRPEWVNIGKKKCRDEYQLPKRSYQNVLKLN